MRTVKDRLANSLIGKLTKRFASRVSFIFLDYYKAKGKDTLALLHEVYAEEVGTVPFDPSELFMIHSLALAQRAHGGDFAEVGVFRGASAKVICAVKGMVPLHLFDTWSGLPSVGELDTRFKKGMFATGDAFARERLNKYPNVFFYKGLFPDTSEPVQEKKFSFVHFDVDTYESTKACLEFFYPRMLSGSIMLSHDYAQREGVHKAFDEFMVGKPDKFIELPVSQCMILKS